MKKYYCAVTLDTPLRQNFDYLSQVPILVGCRVKVPFGRRHMIGVVVEIKSCSDYPDHQLKWVEDVIDTTPILPELSLALASWCAHYYHYAKGPIIQMMLPQHSHAKPKPKAFYALNTEFQGETTSKQSACLHWCRQQAKTDRFLMKTLNDQGFGVALVKKLVANEALVIEWHEQVEDSHSFLLPLPEVEAPLLNEAQLNAVNRIKKQESFQSNLIDGVTGSGKTEVYIRLIIEKLKQGKQVLVLVPEIGLTPQTIKRFRQRVTVPCVQWHSAMTAKARACTWPLIQSGQARLVIGTRSALFNPMPELGLIVIDEVHDPSFKQQTGLRYQASDVASVLGKMHDIPVVMGTATPSLAHMANLKNRLLTFVLPKRATGQMMPRFELLDMKNVGRDCLIHPQAQAEITQCISRGEQCLIFINQRGLAPAMICHDCGHVASCKRCDAKLTLHRAPEKLVCHHCGYRSQVLRSCQSCHSSLVEPIGAGTEKIEQWLQQRYPEERCLRIDRDTITSKKVLEDHLVQISEGKASLLVGTQMLAKGHHFPKLNLVIVLNCDAALFSQDVFATERMAQLLIQVAGRAGRERSQGRVMVQSLQPENPMLKSLLFDGYHSFGQQLLRERQLSGLPPYGAMALIRAEAKHEKQPQVLFDQLMRAWRLDPQVRCLGPMPSFMKRKQGYTRVDCFIWAPSPSLRYQALQAMDNALQSLPKHQCRWTIDVDPITLS